MNNTSSIFATEVPLTNADRLARYQLAIRTVCSWCNWPLKYSVGGAISHGICKQCFKEHEKALEEWSK